ncbi:MAG: hypothetical protein A3E84_01830 [Gammaproteobacteria bacterium RIFCSPHIGHO2_12_FULL_42_13]|nr:MAG: hypothetical protein A3E84_01830 [Gammaproteobacteria bacterium RIFCSPHIGHO2_12_FULL_42_13]
MKLNKGAIESVGFDFGEKCRVRLGAFCRNPPNISISVCYLVDYGAKNAPNPPYDKNPKPTLSIAPAE